MFTHNNGWRHPDANYKRYTRPWASPNSCWSPPRTRQPKAYHRSTAVDYADYYTYGQTRPATYVGDTRGSRAHGFSYRHNGYYDYDDDYYAYRQSPATYAPLPRVQQPPDPGIREELDSIRGEVRSILQSLKSLVQNLQAEQSNRASELPAPELTGVQMETTKPAEFIHNATEDQADDIDEADTETPTAVAALTEQQGDIWTADINLDDEFVGPIEKHLVQNGDGEPPKIADENMGIFEGKGSDHAAAHVRMPTWMHFTNRDVSSKEISRVGFLLFRFVSVAMGLEYQSLMEEKMRTDNNNLVENFASIDPKRVKPYSLNRFYVFDPGGDISLSVRCIVVPP